MIPIDPSMSIPGSEYPYPWLVLTDHPRQTLTPRLWKEPCRRSCLLVYWIRVTRWVLVRLEQGSHLEKTAPVSESCVAPCLVGWKGKAKSRMRARVGMREEREMSWNPDKGQLSATRTVGVTGLCLCSERAAAESESRPKNTIKGYTVCPPGGG